ncbi:FliI/YscN family ATPase [Shimia thalassica]|uniref:FliI/YscN family ATPase n=1 Tax=Shimia thalassica TaxID=1715693 RepID=UPI0026E2FBA9|nr:FliI/YscN family ATPase [Shimia thalassica]MDO6523008.1 FliI/YscN family ATPase [Shimia thalassica]
MTNLEMLSLKSRFSGLKAVQEIGRICAVEGNLLRIQGLGGLARVGDSLEIETSMHTLLTGEVIQLHGAEISVLPNGSPEGVAINDRVRLIGSFELKPSSDWIGRIINAQGQPIDGLPLMSGSEPVPIKRMPPNATVRKPLGERLETGLPIFNTMLPIVRGQRIGLFAGSGVGKSTLLARLASDMSADVVVIALVGERGREIREFVENAMGKEGMARSVVIAATSDQPPSVRKRCALTAMATAEFFRDQGKHVLLLVDSVTRFAEAHREVAVAGGEMPSLRGYPPSTAHTIMSLCERAGPGEEGQGDITAVFSVLVAGSDMDEPIADILRGVLDGHVVLDRKIAERGRFPAVDIVRSVSRSLPGAANEMENKTITTVRRLLGAYDESEVMIKAGLYNEGSDPVLDVAIRAWPDLDKFWAEAGNQKTKHCFSKLNLILRRAKA